MKLSKFIVLFFCCVALFAMLFQSPANARMKQLQIATKTYGQSEQPPWEQEEPPFEFDEPDWDDDWGDDWDDPLFTALYPRDIKPVLGFITNEIEISGKFNANETRALLSNVKAAIDGQPFVLTYATDKNMALLEECVNTVEFIYGYTPQCERIKAKISKIRESSLLRLRS